MYLVCDTVHTKNSNEVLMKLTNRIAISIALLEIGSKLKGWHDQLKPTICSPF
jgi:hypothetical protein